MLNDLAPYPFAPIVGAEHKNGRTGEDFAFCRRAIEQGFTLAVDPQVKLPHLKLGAYEPDLSSLIVRKEEPTKMDHVPDCCCLVCQEQRKGVLMPAR
jgi:hypothetical protein